MKLYYFYTALLYVGVLTIVSLAPCVGLGLVHPGNAHPFFMFGFSAIFIGATRRGKRLRHVRKTEEWKELFDEGIKNGDLGERIIARFEAVARLEAEEGSG